ncbi:MAG: hypothetical protein HY908_23005 [Myxococcales bacterium]|nr:hypothetical protein [Myxococcales bacterium]
MAETKRPKQRGTSRSTQAGYADPATLDPDAVSGPLAPPDALPGEQPPAPDKGGRGREERKRREPSVEIATVYERRSGSWDPVPWRAVEVWTRNRIYGLDAQLTCIEVIDRISGRAEHNHVMLGARLSGGQRRDGSVVSISQPFPVPGTDAVFKHQPARKGAFGRTSRVERVVVRVRVTDVSFGGNDDDEWARITAVQDRR